MFFKVCAYDSDEQIEQLSHTELIAFCKSLKLENKELQEQTMTDSLTGLGNRRRLNQSLDAEISLILRDNHFPLSLVMFDIDHFKKVNDIYGHLAGDTVLIKIGDMLKTKSRDTDVPCRYGGEEFAIVLVHTAAAGAKLYAESLRASFEKASVKLGEKRIPFTASFGVVTIEKQTCLDRDAFIKVADDLMYEAKHLGRNRVCAQDFTAKNKVLPFPNLDLVQEDARVLVAQH